MEQTPEALQSREQFFAPCDLRENLTGCGDERPVIGADDVLINVFGGPGANVAWNIKIMQEAVQPGSVTSTFAETTGEVTLMLVAEEIKTTVHSDDHTEHDSNLDVTKDADGDIGCGYLKLRQPISTLIGESGQEIIDILVREKPELYDSEEGRAILQRYVEANAALASRESVFTSGRDVARTAVGDGAGTIVVTGDHVATVGFLNDRPNTTFDTQSAMDKDLPAYNHNSWAAIESFQVVQDQYGFTDQEFQAANDVDAVGTMLALGVQDIIARK